MFSFLCDPLIFDPYFNVGNVEILGFNSIVFFLDTKKSLTSTVLDMVDLVLVIV